MRRVLLARGYKRMLEATSDGSDSFIVDCWDLGESVLVVKDVSSMID